MFEGDKAESKRNNLTTLKGLRDFCDKGCCKGNCMTLWHWTKWHSVFYQEWETQRSTCLSFNMGLYNSTIPQVHYINHATSHNNNSHVTHTILICIEHCCKWNEINRQTANSKCRCI